MKNILLCLVVMYGLSSCNTKTNTEDSHDSSIVCYGGDILTMQGDTPTYADALVQRYGKIAYVGSREEAFQVAGAGHQMMVVWTAVNRVSRNGETIGAAERVSPYEALKAITINAAYQYFEEDSKGSLEEGKLANLVVLEQNPLKVDPMTIKDIKVLETFKEGTSIYKANSTI